MTPEQRQASGQQLLDNQTFNDCIIEVNKSINRELDTIKPNDLKAMQGIVIMRQAANKIYNYIVSEAHNKDNEVKAFNARKKGFLRRA